MLRHFFFRSTGEITSAMYTYRFKDAAACIRRTATPYHYQLVVQRAFEEGEEQLADETDEDDSSKDEKTFLLDESLQFRSSIRDGQAVLFWNDLLGVRSKAILIYLFQLMRSASYLFG